MADHPAALAARRASALLAQANGTLNLALCGSRLTRSGMREAASWARQAADALEAGADLDATPTPAVLSKPHRGTGDSHGRTGKATRSARA
jgi:hypothetical protein